MNGEREELRSQVDPIVLPPGPDEPPPAATPPEPAAATTPGPLPGMPLDPSAAPGDRTIGRRMQLAARRVFVTLVGVVVLVVGVVLLFLPGQGILTVIAGLAILATEYAWARRAYMALRRRSRQALDGARERVQARRAAKADRHPDGGRDAGASGPS